MQVWKVLLRLCRKGLVGSQCAGSVGVRAASQGIVYVCSMAGGAEVGEGSDARLIERMDIGEARCLYERSCLL